MQRRIARPSSLVYPFPPPFPLCPCHPFPHLPSPTGSPSPSCSSQARPTISSHVKDILSRRHCWRENSPSGRITSPRPQPVCRAGTLRRLPRTCFRFQVVSKLGAGSYTAIYPIREVLSRSPPSEDDHVYPGGRLELDDTSSMRAPTEYGREYATKLLSKADLGKEDLYVQLTEVTCPLCHVLFVP